MKLLRHLRDHAFIYFLGLATTFLIFYTIYFFSDSLNNALSRYDKWISYVASVSMILFTTGIFTVSLKYFQFIGLFQDEFNKAIGSSAFDEKLTKQLKQVTFSKKFLLGQSNLNAIWEKVTLCMFQQAFPEIYTKVKKKIRNVYFEKDSVTYYYKNFQIHYDITLHDEKYITINEYASYTIIRPTADKFSWDFGYIYNKTDDEKVGIEVGGKILTCNNRLFNADDIKSVDVGEEFVGIKVEIELDGHTEYHIERHVKCTINVENDREHSFSSDRIIDDMTINIKHDDDLEIIFSPVNDQHFYPNGTYPGVKHAYINRDVFLPGEKFKLFFIRRN